jgi:hypothetical protein
VNIEAYIQGNTEAIQGLTEAIIKLTIALEQKPTCGCGPKTAAKAVVKTVEEPVKEASVDFPTAKALINSLALTHREEIKALNKKYELGVFADLLIDKNDVSKGVKNTETLEKYYAELQAMGA